MKWKSRKVGRPTIDWELIKGRFNSQVQQMSVKKEPLCRFVYYNAPAQGSDTGAAGCPPQLSMGPERYCPIVGQPFLGVNQDFSYGDSIHGPEMNEISARVAIVDNVPESLVNMGH